MRSASPLLIHDQCPGYSNSLQLSARKLMRIAIHIRCPHPHPFQQTDHPSFPFSFIYIPSNSFNTNTAYSTPPPLSSLFSFFSSLAPILLTISLCLT